MSSANAPAVKFWSGLAQAASDYVLSGVGGQRIYDVKQAANIVEPYHFVVEEFPGAKAIGKIAPVWLAAMRFRCDRIAAAGKYAGLSC